ncbi:MAG: hypothetical protein P8H59_02445 [Flavobacteriales bacterium]|nr:hypothetical protein [Flavobacteriales bacterium]MDG1779785.1 hypothetical protein [Flavobacteriales bacterium]MDG2246855.1 hypothetical protein [Flavobacteriales bacterium]
MNNKVYIGVIAVLLMACAYLGYNLSKKGDEVVQKTEEIGGLEIERQSLELELQKMSFSYDTLRTENSYMMAEMAAQRTEIEDLLKKVKDKNWSVSKLKKEASTLRSIMKGYIVTIDSLNQLNQNLMAENDELNQRVTTVEGENDELLQRQENMEGLIATGQVLQTASVSATAIRLTSGGNQRETNRSSKTEMIKACFTLMENPIAKPGEKNLYMRIIAPDGSVLANKDGNATREFNGEGVQNFSVSRTIDYNNQRMDVCVFYTVQSDLEKGDYKMFIYEEGNRIGTIDLALK